jgi:hypothetical protein
MDNVPPRPDDPDRQYKLRYVRKVLGIERKPGIVHIITDEKQRHTAQRHDHRTPSTLAKRVEANVHQTGQVQPLEAVNSEAEANDIPDLPLKLAKSSGRRITKDDANYDDVDDRFRSRSSWLEVPGYMTLDIPTVMNMEAEYGQSYVYNFKRETPTPSDVGVENMAPWSEFDPDILTDEHHGWFAVTIDHCENCWVTDIKATNFVSGIKAGPGSKHVTIQDMYMLQGQMGLVKRCYATDARHDFMTGAKIPGPNVFVDSKGIRSNNDAGPHGKSPPALSPKRVNTTTCP